MLYWLIDNNYGPIGGNNLTINIQSYNSIITLNQFYSKIKFYV